MSKVTPKIGTKGTFVLKSPWVVNPGEIYTVSEIKTLDQLSRTGVDPKNSIYGKMQLIDGSNGFSWADEVAQEPKIIILTGTRGNKIVVPDTYIANYPDISPVEYQRYFVSIDLGSYPIGENFDEIAGDLANYASGRTGLRATATTYTAPLTNQPTSEEHTEMVKARELNRPVYISYDEEINSLRAQIVQLQKTTEACVKKLRNHGLLPE